MDKIKLVVSEPELVRISLCTRIDTNNAEECYDELNKLQEENPKGRLEIDCSKLSYISSAGLRVLLRILKKQNRTEKVLLTDVSSSVYEILELSGFSELFDVRKALRNISVDGCEVIGRGANGVVYRLDDETIVKVYDKSMPIEDIDKERQVSKEALINGIETAIAFDTVKVGNQYGIVFELLNSQSLSSYMKNNPESFDECAKKYIDVYRKIHNTEVNSDKFPSCKDKYLYYIEGCSEWYTDEELEKLRALVNSIPDRNTLIHGDYHPHNIMLQNGEIILIDMGDMSFGHPIFDFLSTAATQANLLDINPDFAEIHTGMPRDMIKRLWYALLEGYFSDKTQDEIETF